MRSYMPFVERAFDLNDYFLLLCIAIFYGLMYWLPKRLPRSVTCLLLLFSSTVASMFDNSLGGNIFDKYDIMDGPAYTIMDFVVYFFYAPLGYFFIYVYDRLQLQGTRTIFYLAGSSLLSVGFEWVCVKAGVFHYKNGYVIYYSYCVYLITQTATILFYRLISNKKVTSGNS